MNYYVFARNNKSTVNEHGGEKDGGNDSGRIVSNSHNNNYRIHNLHAPRRYSPYFID